MSQVLCVELFFFSFPNSVLEGVMFLMKDLMGNLLENIHIESTDIQL